MKIESGWKAIFDVPSNADVKFRNNPFNYTHSEEQYVTNPRAKILINYEAYNIPSNAPRQFHNPIIATYKMNYLAGRVINLGIWGHVVEDNKTFVRYFDNVILPLALGQPVNSTQYNDKFSSVNGAIYISVSATAPSGAVVNYPPPPFKSIGSKFIPVCTPPPGSTFPIGATKVRCIATDKTDNKTIIATFTVKVTAEPCINYNMDTNTIDIMCKANLSKINRLVNNPSVLEKDPHGVWVLYANLRVSPQGELIINRTDTSWLKIANQKFHENEPNFILISGNAQIDGVKITSWNPHSNDVIRQNVKGFVERPYILINNSSGSTNISNSEIAFLGSASSPGEYGILFRSGKGGSIIANNTFHVMPAGFYSDSVGYITIRKNNFNGNSNFGIAIYQSQ